MTTEQSATDKMSEKPAAATSTTAGATESTVIAAAVAPAPTQQKLSESDDFTEDSADNTADAAREDTSQQSGLATVESEYDTASDSPSDGEEEYDEQDEESGESGESGEEEEDEEDLGSDTDGGGSDDDVIEVLDYERQSGDGQEQEADAKKKVDDDEDRSNPQYIPKKGTFYEHDDRTLEDEEDGKDEDDENAKNDDPSVGGGGGGSGEGRKGVEKSMASKTMKKWQASADRWTHDRFDESEQAPKSRAELVSAYGYDIRSEDGPPRARRRRRYARGPNKYTRNWEDEDAYSKSNNVNEHTRQRKTLPPRPEEFPELGGTNNNNNSSLNSSGSGSKLRSSQNMRRASRQSRSSIDERLDERSGGRPRPAERRRVDHDRGMDRDRGGDRYDQQRGAERNWDREREYDQQQHDGQYRDNRTDGSRYSAERMSNNNNSYHNKENKLLNSRSSKEKDRRGSDYKVITSLQFKNQTRNKTNEGGLPIAGPGGVAGGQVVHSNSGGALSGSSQSNKMNNAMIPNAASGVPERMLDQRAVQQHHYPNQQQQQAQLIQQQPPPQIPQQQTSIQQAQPQPQQIQQQQLHQQQSYDDHYDSYGDSKMPKDAKFPYNPPANATIQSVEIGQTDIPKYPPPPQQQQAQRPSKDRQPQVSAGLPATSNVAALNARSQISPRQIVATPQQQQQQYQLQQAQYQQQQLHGPPTGQTSTQVPPPQLPQQQSQPSSKRYSNLRQRSTLDQPPNVVAVPSPLHEQQQQQLLHQQQQQQLLLQQELHNQQQKLVTSQAPKPGGYPQQPTLPLNLPNEYLSQPAAATKPQPSSQAPPVQYQHAAAAAAYYNPNTPSANDFGTTNPSVTQQPSVNQQAPNPLLSAPQYPQYSQPSNQYIQAPPPAAYIPQTTAAPQPTPQPATAAPPPQILNYVPTINPTPPAQYPAAPYTYTQNTYTPVAVPQPVAPAPVVPINPSPSAATAALYQSSGGITYYAPQSQTQAPRPLPSQRRPTAAIPILAPPDRKTKNNRSDNTGGTGGGSNDAEESQQTGSNNAADNIDHILDNMFVQRPPYQPPSATTTAQKSPSPAPGGNGDKDVGKDADKEAVDKMGESVKNLTIQEENRPVLDALAATGSGGADKLDLAATTSAVDPTAG